MIVDSAQQYSNRQLGDTYGAQTIMLFPATALPTVLVVWKVHYPLMPEGYSEAT